MNFKKLKMWMVFVLIFASSRFGFAEDIRPADWRGDYATVFAEWNFATPGSAPDSWTTNPGGLDTPICSVAASSVLHGSYEGRQNVWEVNEVGGLAFYIPNFPDGGQRNIQAQVTYFIDENVEPTWVKPEVGYVVYRDYLDFEKHDNYWITDVYYLEIAPAPGGEWFYFSGEDQNGDPYFPTYIDQVIIETLGTEPILAGDVNGNGYVDGTDLSIVIDNWGQSGLGREFGDLNDNGVVDGPDYTEVLSYWNPPSEPPSEAVPEPATLGLMLVGGLVLIRCRWLLSK